MKYANRVEVFRQAKAEYTGFLASVLWKLTGDKELFTEALQYALLEMWRHVEKLKSKKAAAYICRIALTANSRAWRNRIGRDGQISQDQISIDKDPSEKIGSTELAGIVRRAIAQLPAKQAKAIVMRYIQQQSYKEVAEKLRCSEAGARSNVSKALATLKTKLATLAQEV
jgi:RNA polymerase sigma factor (sigma-70 family)